MAEKSSGSQAPLGNPRLGSSASWTRSRASKLAFPSRAWERGVVWIAVCMLPSLARAEAPSFQREVAPLLLSNCLACHGPKKAEGGYRIDTFERVTSAGDSTSPGFHAKDLEGSEAFRRITSADVKERMPLEGDPLPAEQIELLKKWIEAGAPFDGPDPKAPLASYIPPPKHPAAPESYRGTMP